MTNRFYPEHEKVAPMELTITQKLKDALATMKGPLWVPLLNRGAEKLFAYVIWGSEPIVAPDKRVYDIEFYRKGEGLFEGSDFIVRLLDRDSAYALTERLNNRDPALEELTWFHKFLQDVDYRTKVKINYYEMAGRGEG